MSAQRFLLFLAITTIGFPAVAQPGGLAGCRAITESAARLSCYDALPLPAASPPPQPAAAKAPAEVFGMERSQAPVAAKPAESLDSISSVLPGLFEGWNANSRFKLANGQVWQVNDGSSAYVRKESPQVQITRGMLGAFFLQVEGLNKTARVKRIQ